MRKRFYQPDRAAKPNKSVEVRKIEYRAEPQPQAQQLCNVNYPRKPKPTIYKRTETEVLGQGRYIGEGNTITAFVWMDEEI